MQGSRMRLSKCPGGRAVFLFVLLLLAFAAHAAALSKDPLENNQNRAGIENHGQTLEGKQEVGPHTKLEWNVRTIGALIITCVCALLANGAGIGGGPIYLPVLMVIIGFEVTPATALSHTIVSISAIASSMYGLCARSPNAPDRSLIDWDLAVFIPALLVGVSVGVLFNVIFPRWVQTILLTVLLVVVFFKTLSKGRKMFDSEKKNAGLKQRQSQPNPQVQDDHNSTDDEEEGILHEESYHLKPHKLTRKSMDLETQRLLAQQENGDGEGQLTQISETLVEGTQKAKSGIRGCLGRQPYGKMVAVVLLWVVFLVFQQTMSRYNKCTVAYIGLFLGEVVLYSLLAVLGIYSISRQAQKHPENVDPELRTALLGDGETSGEDASKRTMKKLLLVAAVMAASGLLAGLLGIGGALIFNPFLLALGVHPQVTASTSVLLILFSSSAICISLGFQGYLNASYALVFAPSAFVASIIGVSVIGSLIKRTGHASIIVFILTALIGVGTILTAVFGGIRNVNEIRAGGGIGFKPFCQS